MTHDTMAGDGRHDYRPHWLLWAGAGALLAVPAVAMRFTDDVQWDRWDFLLMGTMLAFVCGLVELATWLSPNRFYRAGFAVAVVTGFLLVWINLAVGIIGTEDDPANGLFGGVLVVGALGALLARFRAGGMAMALLATATAHAAVEAVALFSRWEHPPLLNGIFIALWLLSAALFRVADERRPPVPATGGA